MVPTVILPMPLIVVLVHEQRTKGSFECQRREGKLTGGTTGYGLALVPSWMPHKAGCISQVTATRRDLAENSHCPIVMAFFLRGRVALGDPRDLSSRLP